MIMNLQTIEIECILFLKNNGWLSPSEASSLIFKSKIRAAISGVERNFNNLAKKLLPVSS